MTPSGAGPGSRAWFDRARQCIPGGVNSPVRSFAQVGGHPRVMVRGHGCAIEDVDGRQYIDYVCGWGPLILGHSDPRVRDAIAAAASNGTCFGMPTPIEVELAERIVARVPGVERVRMVNSGTEAVMSALRLARAVTQRSGIVKCSGCYHGHSDALLAAAGSGLATFGLPSSPGVDPATTRQTFVVPYNDPEAVTQLCETRGADIAAVIVEPIAANMGLVLPAAGWLSHLRDVTRAHGILLIFDEVVTGFRVGPGGVQAECGVIADLTTFGKIIGGGLPVGAYGGPAALLDRLAPDGPVYQAGTLSGNPATMAAGVAVLDALSPPLYRQLAERTTRLAAGLRDACRTAEVDAVVQQHASMLTVFFTSTGVTCFDDARAADHAAYGRFFHAMLERGVHLPPSGYETWFVSAAHDDAAIDRTLDAAGEALTAIAAPRG